MRSNRSVHQVDSPEYIHDSTLQYDISKLYPRMKTRDLVLYVIQRMCSALITSDSDTQVTGFDIQECLMKSNIEFVPRRQVESNCKHLWTCLEDAVLYAHCRCEDLIPLIHKHKHASQIAAIDAVLSNLQYELKTHYQPIHVFRPMPLKYPQLLNQVNPLGYGMLNSFTDMYRDQQLQGHLLTSMVHFVCRKRSKSTPTLIVNPHSTFDIWSHAQPNIIRRKQGMNPNDDRLSNASQPEHISINKSSSMTSIPSMIASNQDSTADAINLILDNIAQRLADKRSNISDNGSLQQDYYSPSEISEQYIQQESRVINSEQLDILPDELPCQQLFLVHNYFSPLLGQQSINGSFVVVSSDSSFQNRIRNKQ